MRGIFGAVEAVLTGVERVYRRALAWVLDHRFWTLAGATAVLLLVYLLIALFCYFLPDSPDLPLIKP